MATERPEMANVRGGPEAKPEELREPISVLIVDECLCASPLAERFALEDAIDVVGLAVDLSDALERVRADAPDLVITEVQLRDAHGVDAVSAIRAANEHTKVVVLTRRTDPATVQAAFDAGCAGFLTKRQSPSDVVRGIRAAFAGDVPVEPALLTALLATDSASATGIELTQRESAVLRLFSHGRTYAQVAELLSLSVNTVRNHAQRILAKLGAHSKLEAVLIARREGLLTD